MERYSGRRLYVTAPGPFRLTRNKDEIIVQEKTDMERYPGTDQTECFIWKVMCCYRNLYLAGYIVIRLLNSL